MTWEWKGKALERKETDRGEPGKLKNLSREHLLRGKLIRTFISLIGLRKPNPKSKYNTQSYPEYPDPSGQDPRKKDRNGT